MMTNLFFYRRQFHIITIHNLQNIIIIYRTREAGVFKF